MADENGNQVIDSLTDKGNQPATPSQQQPQTIKFGDESLTLEQAAAKLNSMKSEVDTLTSIKRNAILLAEGVEDDTQGIVAMAELLRAAGKTEDEITAKIKQLTGREEAKEEEEEEVSEKPNKSGGDSAEIAALKAELESLQNKVKLSQGITRQQVESTINSAVETAVTNTDYIKDLVETLSGIDDDGKQEAAGIKDTIVKEAILRTKQELARHLERTGNLDMSIVGTTAEKATKEASKVYAGLGKRLKIASQSSQQPDPFMDVLSRDPVPSVDPDKMNRTDLEHGQNKKVTDRLVRAIAKTNQSGVSLL